MSFRYLNAQYPERLSRRNGGGDALAWWNVVCEYICVAAGCNAYTITNGRITLTFESAQGLTTSDGDRVDGAGWVDSSGTPTGNLVSNAVHRPFTCGDQDEFWGEAVGFPDELMQPLLVHSGAVSRFQPNGTMRAHLAGCSQSAVASATTATRHILGTAPGQINSVKVPRAFAFGASTPVFPSSGLSDNDSASNVSSVVLLQPAGGWKASVTVIEYLCFYDENSFTRRDQANGVLPQGCRVE